MKRFLIICVLLLAAATCYAMQMIGFGAGGAGAVVVQATGLHEAGSGLTYSKAFTSSVTAGNTIIVGCRINSGGVSIDNVSDSLGNVYTQRLASTSNRYKFYEAPNINGGSCTVTVTINNAAATSRSMGIWEVSGLVNTGAYDVGAVSNADRTGVVATDGNYTDNVTTTAAGDFIASFTADTTDSWATLAAGTSQVERFNGGTVQFQSQDRVVSAAGSYNATWTPSDTDIYYWAIAAFKATP